MKLLQCVSGFVDSDSMKCWYGFVDLRPGARAVVDGVVHVLLWIRGIIVADPYGGCCVFAELL